MVTAWQLVALYVVLDVALVWAAGYLLAMEDVVGGVRTRVENAAYRDADSVRYNAPGDPTGDPNDLFWDRVQPWPLGRRAPDGESRWTYRGRVGFQPDAAGHKVPTRLLSPGRIRYAVPALDGVPLGRRDRAATLARGKAADLWGCPKCSGMWGGAVAAAVLFAAATWPFGWLLAVVGHVAAWGLARRVGWSKG